MSPWPSGREVGRARQEAEASSKSSMSILEEAGAWARAGSGIEEAQRTRGQARGAVCLLEVSPRVPACPQKEKDLGVRRVSQIQTTYICDWSSRRGAMSKADPL